MDQIASNLTDMQELKQRFEDRKADVEAELKILNEEKRIPAVRKDCPEKYRALAERLVALQLEKGEFWREDLDKSDMYKIKDISKAKKISFREVVSMLIENDRYINREIDDARQIIKFLEDFDSCYQEYYQKYQHFPYNVLSPESKRYLTKIRVDVSPVDKLKLLLEVYRPEFANIVLELKNYDALPKNRNVLTDEEIKNISLELSQIAKDGTLDELFSPKYETYFKDLCSKLKRAGYTFERFINEHTALTYTICFKAEIEPTVKHMLKFYYSLYGTAKGITANDPYLRNKIEVAQNTLGIFTTKELFEYFGLLTDNHDKINSTIPLHKLREREKDLFDKLEKIYPNKQIGNNLSNDSPEAYAELKVLSKRFGFDDLNDYLKSRGFSRDIDYTKPESFLYLNERDIIAYRFTANCKDPANIEEYLNKMGIYYISPVDNLGTYRKLAYEKHDSIEKNPKYNAY